MLFPFSLEPLLFPITVIQLLIISVSIVRTDSKLSEMKFNQTLFSIPSIENNTYMVVEQDRDIQFLNNSIIGVSRSQPASFR